MSLEDYLKSHYAPTTGAEYRKAITTYTAHCKSAADYGHADIVRYIGVLRAQKGARYSIVLNTLKAIKVYYGWLCRSGQRGDNPARSIRLRDKRSKDIQLQDLFTEEELEGLMGREDYHPLWSVRNKALMGFLVYQGLRPREIAGLRTGDINLPEGSVYVRGYARADSRTLALNARQVMTLHEYLHVVRPKLAGRAEGDSGSVNKAEDYLILSNGGGAMSNLHVGLHVKWRCQGLHKPRRMSCQTIRQSVITNLLKKGTDLRVVQVFAGHQQPSSTERYKQTDVDALRAAVVKYHPFA